MLLLPSNVFGVQTRPRVGRVTALNVTDAADVGSKSFVGTHTSLTGDMGLLFARRSNASPSATITGVTWDGGAVTEAADAGTNGAGRALVYAGWIKGGATGAKTLAVTYSAASARDFCGWIFDIHGMNATPMGATAVSIANQVADTGSQSLAITPAAVTGLLVGIVSAMHSDASPMLANSGWRRATGQRTGNGGTADIAAVLAYRRSGTTSPVTLTGTANGATVTDDWCAAIMEFKL